MENRRLTRPDAVELLTGLVAIPSLSCAEGEASAWLVAQMQTLGYHRAYVDEVGNAVGEMGRPEAARTVVLLGHIDTVPGAIPVRVEQGEQGELLFGRGTVDAKGPLATFVSAVARVGQDWAIAHDLRLVVVGAVEEEYATSRGARWIGARFNGHSEPRPVACIIGEPSSAHRMTLGYKGRLLVELEAARPMAHTAGPDAGVATLAVDFWRWLADHAAGVNVGRTKTFDQVLPSLRELHTTTDEEMNDRLFARAGIRLPLDFDVRGYITALSEWAAALVGVARPEIPFEDLGEGASELSLLFAGAATTLMLRFRGYEPAWRSERNNELVRSFLAAIRTVLPAQQPGFVVKSGTSDMNVVAPLWRCPVVAYGPGDSAFDHTPHEHLSLDEFWSAVLVLEQTLRNLAG